MTAHSCATPTAVTTLVAYWLGEPDAAAEADLEEHLFSCAECSSRLRHLVQLAEGIKRTARGGNLQTVVTAPFIRRLRDAGIRVREYRVEPGGSVFCTVAPEDDLVVAHLHAPLRGVQRLDMMLHDVTTGARSRMEDVAFDPSADEVVLSSSVAELRRLTFATQRVKLVAVQGATDREIGEYTFNHSPHDSRPPAG